MYGIEEIFGISRKLKMDISLFFNMLLFKLCSCGKLTIIDKNAHTLSELPSSQERGYQWPCTIPYVFFKVKGPSPFKLQKTILVRPKHVAHVSKGCPLSKT
jgi:hypothetical protein